MNILYLGYLFGLFIMGIITSVTWRDGNKILSILCFFGIIFIILYAK